MKRATRIGLVNVILIQRDAVHASTSALRQKSLTQEEFRDLLAKMPTTKTLLKP